MGWIARLSDGSTITEKLFLAEGKKYEHLPLEDIISLQVPFFGNYVTVTRANDTQRLIQLKGQRTTTGNDTLPDDHPAKTNPHVETIIFCVINSEGDAIGWSINFEGNYITPFHDNVNDMILNPEHFDLKLDDIEDELPNLFIYTMRRDEVEFSIQ